jgi:hypothetical protein
MTGKENYKYYSFYLYGLVEGDFSSLEVKFLGYCMKNSYSKEELTKIIDEASKKKKNRKNHIHTTKSKK